MANILLSTKVSSMYVMYKYSYAHTCFVSTDWRQAEVADDENYRRCRQGKYHSYIHIHHTHTKSYIYTHILAYTHTYIHTYIHTYTQILTCIHTYVRTCINTYLDSVLTYMHNLLFKNHIYALHQMSSSMKLGPKAKELIFSDPFFVEAINKVRRLTDPFPESNHTNNNLYPQFSDIFCNKKICYECMLVHNIL